MADQICGVEFGFSGLTYACEKPAPCYYFHTSEGDRVLVPSGIEPSKKKSRKQEVDEIAERVEQQTPIGPLDPKQVDWQTGQVQPARGVETDRPQFEIDDWVEYALGVLRKFLAERTTDFTTPEDLWPLVVSPPERRKMTEVVNIAVKRGWMREVAAVRLRGTYRTQDGHEFKMNKLVPVYRVWESTRPVVDLSDVD